MPNKSKANINDSDNDKTTVIKNNNSILSNNDLPDVDKNNKKKNNSGGSITIAKDEVKEKIPPIGLYATHQENSYKHNDERVKDILHNNANTILTNKEKSKHVEWTNSTDKDNIINVSNNNVTEAPSAISYSLKKNHKVNSIETANITDLAYNNNDDISTKDNIKISNEKYDTNKTKKLNESNEIEQIEDENNYIGQDTKINKYKSVINEAVSERPNNNKSTVEDTEYMDKQKHNATEIVKDNQRTNVVFTKKSDEADDYEILSNLNNSKYDKVDNHDVNAGKNINSVYENNNTSYKKNQNEINNNCKVFKPNQDSSPIDMTTQTNKEYNSVSNKANHIDKKNNDKLDKYWGKLLSNDYNLVMKQCDYEELNKFVNDYGDQDCYDRSNSYIQSNNYMDIPHTLHTANRYHSFYYSSYYDESNPLSYNKHIIYPQFIEYYYNTPPHQTGNIMNMNNVYFDPIATANTVKRRQGNNNAQVPEKIGDASMAETTLSIATAMNQLNPFAFGIFSIFNGVSRFGLLFMFLTALVGTSIMIYSVHKNTK